MAVGIQVDGQSPDSIKKMALAAFSRLRLPVDILAADIGSGRGDLEQVILPFVGRMTAVDNFPPIIKSDKVDFVNANLNDKWNLEDQKFDFVFSLEVIEHVENPRHFMREVYRILKPGGYGFISTPNNLNVFSRLNFILKGEHRYFQDSCYPAHITCLVKKDIERLLTENNMHIIGFFYNYEDVLPLLGVNVKFKLNSLSNSLGVLFRK